MISLWLWNVHPQRHMDRFVDGTIILATTPPRARVCAFDHLSSIVPITKWLYGFICILLT